jgi:hypothetical protein
MVERRVKHSRKVFETYSKGVTLETSTEGMLKIVERRLKHSRKVFET